MTTYRLLMGGRPVAEFRDGESGMGHPVKIPGTHTVSDVTLKRGVILDSSLANWLKAAKTKHHLVVQQIDGAGRMVASWSLANATITKYTGPLLSGKGNDVAIEELEIAHEGLRLPIK